MTNPNAAKLAEHLHEQAKWSAGKADDHDDHRSSRSGLSLLDAAGYVEKLPDSDPRLMRMQRARYFVVDDIALVGEYGGQVVRTWNFHGDMGGGSAFMDALAEAADRDAV